MCDLTIKREEHIKYIIDNFDFDRVNEVMILLDWGWFWTNKTPLFSVPTIEDLEKCAINLLNDACDIPDDYGYSSTGGFKATKINDHLELEFIIRDYSSESLNTGPEYEKNKKLKNRRNKLNKINKNEDN